MCPNALTLSRQYQVCLVYFTPDGGVSVISTVIYLYHIVRGVSIGKSLFGIKVVLKFKRFLVR